MRRGFTVMAAVLGLALTPWPALAQDTTSELMASLTRLDRLKTYRVKTTVTPGPQ